MKRLLITGGAGFIGSNFVKHIIKNHPGTKIIILDKLTYAGNLENLREMGNNRNYKFVKGDICDRKIVDKLAEDVDCIINFAAETHVDKSIVEADDFLQTDIWGTYVLLETVKKHKLKRYIQISTDEVYGDIKEDSSKEGDPLKPSNPYAASKAAADLLVLSYYVTYKLPVVITRSSNNFGPFQYPEKVIPLFITNTMENKNLPLYGDGLNIRDWLYVKDNCEAISLVLEKGKEGQIYNVGGGNEKTNLEITRLILEYLGKPESLIQYVKDREGHDRRYSLNSENIAALGWRSQYKFEEALSQTIKWYAENREWWQKIKERKEYKEFSGKWYGER
jgi:dTDP-glucose 4,6-dehydratase